MAVPGLSWPSEKDNDFWKHHFQNAFPEDATLERQTELHSIILSVHTYICVTYARVPAIS